MPEPWIGELDARFGSPDASATSWDDVDHRLDRAYGRGESFTATRWRF